MRSKKVKLKIRHIILICMIIYLAIVLIDQQLKINEINNEIDHVQEGIDNLLVEKEEMEKEIELLKDYDYMEELAREELGLIKPGETIYRVVEED